MRALVMCLALVGCPTDDSERGDVAYGGVCVETNDCELGLLCAGDLTCRSQGEPGTADVGGECSSTAYCRAGLVCDATAVCAPDGDPGTGIHGDACNDTDDCALGLSCDGVCSGLELPLWTGASCEQPGATGGDFRAFYEVPGDAPLAEFYRLPFPNDARVQGGRLDLSGHPSPGPLVPRIGDPVGAVLTALEGQARFGNNQSVFFRFSDEVSFDSLSRGLPGDGSIGIVDLTPGTTYGELHLTGWFAATGRGAYICHNRLSITPLDGRPFLPGHTYAAYVTTAVLDQSGTAAIQDADFAEVIASGTPSSSRLQRAHESLEPLRTWLDEEGLPAADIAAATVFTVQDPAREVTLLRESVHAGAAPTASSLFACEGPAGPFATDESRGCADDRDGFEVQGTVDLPQYQSGSAPFKTLEEGGSIEFSAGPPTEVSRDGVVFSLTLPSSEMPDAGWPVVLYAHGTGGNYQSVVRTGLADTLRDVVLDDGTEVGVAVLSWDAVVHGTRRNEASWDTTWLELDAHAYDPDVLYFNPINPHATRGNALQNGADLFSMVRFARGLDWTAGTSPTGEAIRLDPDNVYFLGHSQGAVSGVAPLAVEPDVDVVVLSGGGGLLIESFLKKTSPRDLLPLLNVGLADPNIGRDHPILNLVQSMADSADAVNFGVRLFADPLDGMPERHVLQIYGLGDTFSPNSTQTALARSLRVHQVSGANTPLDGITERSAPVSANRAAGDATGVVALYGPVGTNDAHFVLFQRTDTERQAAQFFATHVRDGIPTFVVP